MGEPFLFLYKFLTRSPEGSWNTHRYRGLPDSRAPRVREIVFILPSILVTTMGTKRVDAQIPEDDFSEVEEHLKKNPNIRRDSNAGVAEYAFQLASEKVRELDEREREMGEEYKSHQKELQKLAEEV